MPPNVQLLLTHIVLPALRTFLIVGGVAGLLLGAALMVRSDLVRRAGETLNRWISFRRALKPLEITRESWHVVERNRRLVALMMAAGVAYTLAGLQGVDSQAASAALAARWHINAGGAAWLVRSALWFLVLGNAAALVVSCMLAFAPAALATLDRRASRWISTRNAARPANVMVCTFDHWVEHWPRLTGLTIALFSAVEIASVMRLHPA